MRRGDDLETLVEAELASDRPADGDRLKPLLGRLYDRYRDHKRLLDRLVRISDRYHDAERRRSQAYAADYRREVRRIEKLIRISDSYQSMLRDFTERLRILSTRDDLTGLLNRRSMREQLLLAIGRGAAFGLAFVDIDHFKVVNDSQGHLAGDAVLTSLAETIASYLGPDDVCGRWGGEEFLILLPGRSVAETTALAERLRTEVVKTRHASGGPEAFSVTISLGLTLHRPGETLDVLLIRADRALYRAKEAGRNRIVFLSADDDRHESARRRA